MRKLFAKQYVTLPTKEHVSKPIQHLLVPNSWRKRRVGMNHFTDEASIPLLPNERQQPDSLLVKSVHESGRKRHDKHSVRWL
jgi:hypothetical protein